MIKRTLKTLILLSLSSLLWSAQAKRVLDLGQMDIQGEVRRPNVNLVNSKKYFKDMIKKMAHQELKQFERELTQPAHFILTSQKAKR